MEPEAATTTALALVAGQSGGKRPAACMALDSAKKKSGKHGYCTLWGVNVALSSAFCSNPRAASEFMQRMFLFLSGWMTEYHAGGAEAKMLLGFYIYYPKSYADMLQGSIAHASIAFDNRVTHPSGMPSPGFYFTAVLRFDKSTQSSSIQSKLKSKSTELALQARYGKDLQWATASTGMHLHHLIESHKTHVVAACAARGIEFVIPSPADLRRMVEEGEIDNAYGARLLVGLQRLGSALGHAQYKQEAVSSVTMSYSTSKHLLLLEQLTKSKLPMSQGAAYALEAVKHKAGSSGLRVADGVGEASSSSMAPPLLEHTLTTQRGVTEEDDAGDVHEVVEELPELETSSPQTALSQAVFDMYIARSLSTKVPSSGAEAAATVRKVIYSLCQRIIQLELRVTDLINRPSIFESMSRRRHFGGRLHDLPASVNAAIDVERQEVNALLQPLRESAQELIPAAKQPPLMCLRAFTAAPLDHQQVFDVTCKTLPTAFMRIMLERRVGPGYVPALLAVAQRLENMCTDPREFSAEVTDQESAFKVSFQHATQGIACELHKELLVMCSEFEMERLRKGLHASVSSTSQLHVQATDEQLLQGLARPVGACDVYSIFVNCNSTMTELALCSANVASRNRSDASTEGVPATAYLKFSIAAFALLRSCAAAVKSVAKVQVHVFLLACNMHNLVEEMCKRVTDVALEYNISAKQLREQVEICFSTAVFPAGVFLLAIQAYAECTTTSLAECATHIIEAVKVWRVEHDDMAINDGAESGKELKPLESRIVIASLGELIDLHM